MKIFLILLLGIIIGYCLRSFRDSRRFWALVCKYFKHQWVLRNRFENKLINRIGNNLNRKKCDLNNLTFSETGQIIDKILDEGGKNAESK